MEYAVNDRYVDFIYKDSRMRLEPVTDSIIRCIYTKNDEFKQESVLINRPQAAPAGFHVTRRDGQTAISTDRLCVVVSDKAGSIVWQDGKTGKVYLKDAGKVLAGINVIRYSTGGEEPVAERVRTVDGERSFVQNLKPYADRRAYRGKLYFDWQEEEGIYGLGQAEEGIYNYRGQNQYLYQHNMRIPMPMFVSTNGYGILADCGSLMTFNDDARGSYLFFDTVDQIDYYFIRGDKIDDIIAGFRYLTGEAAMLPRWAYGYIQSKEQYYTADELAGVIRRYRELQVPIDCVVQDWNSWAPGSWGEKIVDKARYGNLKECLDEIHNMHAHAMVSVWPNMKKGLRHHTELAAAGYLLQDFSTYDPFREGARRMYWKHAKEELFQVGFDAWWCDSTEPFTGPDWNGEVKREAWERYHLVGSEHKRYLDPAYANLYALMHAKGIYENQKNETRDIRVLNLTRSGYASGQRYAAVLWSGDTSASWETLKQQIVEGLNMGLSGYPYWTLDIGGFFTVCEKWQNRGCGCNQDPSPKWFWQGGYEDGTEDAGYRELYVRWLELGAFLPMFRSHGTDTPREIWNFGSRGDMFYDAIEKFIKLRYRLMPYIYSLAGAVRLQGATIMRSLLFDFMEDKKAREVKEGFMFGPSLLVYAVTEPMYYEAGNVKIEKAKTRDCYLPEGTDWYDYWTGAYYTGGQVVTMGTPIDSIPVFVRAGTVLPAAGGLQYADEVTGALLELQIYPGADGVFVLYEDEGNNYNYEKGNYTTIELRWEDADRCLTIGKRRGYYDGMEKTRTFRIRLGGMVKEVSYTGEEETIPFTIQRPVKESSDK